MPVMSGIRGVVRLSGLSRSRTCGRALLLSLLVGALVTIGTTTISDAALEEAAAEPASRPKMMAYLSYTAAAQGKASYRQHGQFIDEISPSWWRPSDAADGSLSLQQPGVTVEDTLFVDEANEAGTAVWGVVANYYGKGQWRWDTVSKLLNDASLRAAHVRALVRLAVDKGYVGIDVDYEHGTRSEDRAVFSLFVRELAVALHTAGKKLSVTVQPKLSEPGNQPRHHIQNWKAIGAVADEVHIMLYDYWPDNGHGSQSPLWWWKEQAEFAVTQIPADKIMLGAPTYGYHWAGDKSPVEDLEWRSIETLRNQVGASRVFDRATRSARYSFQQSGTRHHVWYEDSGALVKRARVVRNYGLRGIFFWRLGGEDPRMWRAVRTELDR